MVYAVMLDNFQHTVRADQWCVHFDGSLDDCKGYETLTDPYPWAKSDYGDRVRQEDHPVQGEPGAIYELTPVTNFAATLDEVDTRRLAPPERSPAASSAPPIALVMGGFLAGVVAGLLLGRVPNPFSGDDK